MAEELAESISATLTDAAEAIPSLSRLSPLRRPSLAGELGLWFSTPGERELRAPHPWDPTCTVEDRLHERTTTLASSETSLAKAQALESLDGGSELPHKSEGG